MIPTILAYTDYVHRLFRGKVRAGGRGVPLAPEGLRRALWFVGLWAAGVAAVGTAGLLIRWALLGADGA